MTIRAVIAEDEPVIADALRRQLERLWPELHIVALAADGDAAKVALAEHRVEIAFLDIKMPGCTGMEVAASITWPCQIVFVTAYDQFAIEAFERAAVDYLLKPVSDDRLARTVTRLKQRLDIRLSADGNASDQAMAELPDPGFKQTLSWIRASRGNSVHLVPINDILYFRSKDKYTIARTINFEYLIRDSLKDIERRIAQNTFIRVHRSYFVNVKHVSLIEISDGKAVMKLPHAGVIIPIARRRVAAIPQCDLLR